MTSNHYSNVFGSKNVIIGISGIIGVGKSTLTKLLAEKMNADSMFEVVDENEYLEKFYKDIRKYSFPMQIYLLNQRFSQHQKMVWSQKNTIQDRTIYEDVIFAKMLYEDGLMEKLDFETYCDLYKNMSNFLHRPDLIIYLDVDPKIAFERIKKRSRNCESSITLSYLQKLYSGYEEWLDDISGRIPVLRLDWKEFDTIDNVIAKIKNKLKSDKRGLIL